MVALFVPCPLKIGNKLIHRVASSLLSNPPPRSKVSSDKK